MIDIHNLNFPIIMMRKYYKNMDLCIEKGSFWGIAGPSGCGKSSLIKAICKLENCSGSVFINNTDIGTLSRKQLSQIIALVPQNPF